MNPTAIHPNHRRPLANGFKENALWALLNLEVAPLAQTEPVADRLGKHYSASLVNFYVHAIYNGICHLQWQVLSAIAHVVPVA